MSKIEKIKNLISDLNDQLALCKRCGICMAVCPVFAETGLESDVARGKLALLDGLVQEMFNSPHKVFDYLNRCLLCGSCSDKCPRNVRVLDIFIKARAILSGFIGLSVAEKLMLRFILSHPMVFNRSVQHISGAVKLFAKPASDVLGTFCARSYSPWIGNRHFIPIASTPFHQMIPSLNKPVKTSGIKAAFFTGCLIDKLFPRVAVATVTALQFHDVNVDVPEVQACCGAPAISSGDLNTFHKLIDYNLRIFNPDNFDFLITSCATCTFIIKTVWPMMMQKKDLLVQHTIEKIAAKTIDINRFLVSVTGLQKNRATRGNTVDVTYHDPCHMKKNFDISAEPRALICANRSYRLKEMSEADRCCGFGGSFNIKHYGLSSSIGKRKMENIKASGCRIVATGCPACMLQISDALSASETHLSVKHPVEIYAESFF